MHDSAASCSLADRCRQMPCTARGSPTRRRRPPMNHYLTNYCKELFLRSLRTIRGGFLEIVCPEETHTFGEPGASLRAMAVIHDERFFVRALTGADVGMGESYMDGDWTTPDLVSLVRIAVRNLRLLDARHRILSGVRAMALRIRHRLRENTIRGSR